jgi:hypothetical protein
VFCLFSGVKWNVLQMNIALFEQRPWQEGEGSDKIKIITDEHLRFFIFQ